MEGLKMAHSIEVPSEIIRKWQEFVNLLAEIMHVPSASIMRADPPHIKVFVSSTSKGNPCEPGALDTGPYCETVMKTGQPLLVPDALENEAWKANPHVRAGMISYLGVPIGWPDGRLFGTICVRDNKRNEYSEAYLKLLLHFRDMLQADLNSLVRLHGEIEEREAKIRRSEANLAEAQRLSHTGSWAIDPAMTKIFYWSEECYRIWGFDPAQGLPNRETVWRRIHPDDRDRIYRETQEALRQKRDYKVDYRIVLPDGTVKYLEGIGHHLFSADGEFVQVVGTNVDITERKRAERALREREAKIRRLVDANIIGIFIWDFDGRILEANEAFLHIVGYDHEDLVAGRIRWTDLTPPEWRDRDTRLMQEHKVSGTLPPFEKEYFRKDGSRVPVLIGVATFEGGGDQGVAFVLDLTERKRAEQALRESEYNLQKIIETVPSHLWSADPAGEPTQLSQRALDYYGIQLEDFKHGGWEAYIHPDDYPETARAFYHAIQTGNSYQDVVRLRRADGEFRWHQVRGEPLRDQQGNIVQWYGLSVDIDDAKKAEDQLRRSEAYLAEAQRLSHTGTAVFNDTTIIHWSDETYRIFGFDPRNGVPSREAALQTIHPDEREQAQEEARRAVRQKRDYKLEFRLVLPATIKYIEGIAHPKFSVSGELMEVVSTIIDVTERKRAEQALRESEARARSALDGIAGLVVIMAPNGELETVNRQCLEYFGQSLEELKNWETSDTVHPEDLPHVLELSKRGIASGIPFHYDQRLRRFDGEYRWFDNRAVPIRDDSGRIARWYVLLTDIEDRTRALAQLEQMQSDFAHMNRVSMLGEWAAELSHEITQPIASARNNARAAQNFLDKQPPDMGEVREALSCVVGDADRAGDIVDRIRDHIKKAPPRKAQFDLNEAINEVIVLGRSAIIKNGVSVQTRLSEGLLLIHGDRVQLQQVVLNVLLNAVEAMGSTEAGTRELFISTDQDHRGVLVAVRDSGPGLDPSLLERVFDAFYTTKSSGMGMGLSICRSIIDAHGGRLWAEANDPRGVIFQFTLPAAQVGP